MHLIVISMVACTVTGYEDRYKIDDDYVESIINDAPYPLELKRPSKKISEGTVEVGIEDALKLFLDNNREYLNQLESLFVSKLDVELAKHSYEPIFQPLSMSVARNEVLGNRYSVSEDISTGITQRLPTGGSLSLSSNASANQDKDAQTHTYTYSNSVTMSLPLLRDAGLISGLSDLIQDTRSYVYAKREFEDFKENALINVIKNYFNLILLERRINNFEANLQSAKKLLTRAQIEYELGRKQKSEVFRAQVQVTNAENQLQNARENLNLQRNLFKIDLGLDPSVNVVVKTAEIDITKGTVDEEEYINKALEHNRSWKNQMEQFEDVKRTLYIAYNALLPDLNVTAGATVSNSSEKMFSEYDIGVRSWSGGLDFKYPLDRFPVNVNFHKRLLEYTKAERNLDLQKDQLIRGVKELIIQVRRSQLSVKLNQRAVEEAEKNLKLVEIEYETGVGNRSSLDIVTAQSELLNAKNSYESGKVEYIISTLSLKQFVAELNITEAGWYK